MRRPLIISVVLASCLISTAAAAQGPETAGAEPQPSASMKLKTIDFAKGDEITGTWHHGQGAVVAGEVHGDLSSLINVRANFLDEMIQSAESL